MPDTSLFSQIYQTIGFKMAEPNNYMIEKSNDSIQLFEQTMDWQLFYYLWK